MSPRQPEPEAASRSIVLVGMMGAGKSAIGRRLAPRLGLPFVDADTEIERAAGCTIEAFFAAHGEAAFRDGERRVIARLLGAGPIVLATGGGAFIDPGTRANIARAGVSVWLKADIDTLLARVQRRGNRPLLKQGDPRAVLDRLLAERDPVYAQADITVESTDAPVGVMVDKVLAALESWHAAHPRRAVGAR
jgi:shikimate kinase